MKKTIITIIIFLMTTGCVVNKSSIKKPRQPEGEIIPVNPNNVSLLDLKID